GGHPEGGSLRVDRRAGRRRVGGDRRAQGPQRAPGAEARAVRRARRRSGQRALLPPHRARLRLVLSLPGADRAPGGRAGGAGGPMGATRPLAGLVLVLCLAGCAAPPTLDTPEGGSVVVASQTAMDLQRRVSGFYLRLQQRRFNSLETYHDFVMRGH